VHPEKKLPQDITDKLFNDFGSARVSDALDLLKSNSAASDRVIRCIVYLASGDLEKLRHYTECADRDFRDVIWWAEYIDGEKKAESVRVRDFTKSFSDNKF
jgi:hypothetical protein